MRKPRVSVIKETESGRNTSFLDNTTGKQMSRANFAQQIEQGKYPDYHVRKMYGLKTPASNPNGRDQDNLG